MDTKHLERILNSVANGEVKPSDAADMLKNLPFEDLNFVNIDNHRAIRTGYPETVFCQGKTAEQVGIIMEHLAASSDAIMGTRATQDQFEQVKIRVDDAVYYEAAKMIVIDRNKLRREKNGMSKAEEASWAAAKTIAVVTAGTADIPVAEEAAITAETLGNKVDRIYDVGVAGIHRLFAKLDRIQAANVVIVVAGMEGALASVVGGLVDKPVVAVPTSIGYGANLGGLSALLSMLNSCANGVGIVNIDNGFGAGYLASNINRLSEQK